MVRLNLNVDLQDAFVVNDSPDLANLVLDDHLWVFSVSVNDNSCAQTLCLLGYIALFQPLLIISFWILE
jgi:hypothetical protein